MKTLLTPEIAYQQVMDMLCGDASRVPGYLAEAEIAMAREQLAQPWSDAAFLEAARSLLRYVWHERALFDKALDRVTAPTLWIHGALDRLVHLSAAQEIIRRRPDWTLEVFPTVGHVPMMETPDDFLVAVSAWLDGILPAIPAGSSRSRT